MPISPRASPIGLPALRASSSASSSWCSSSASASRCRSAARSAGVTARQAGNARLRALDRGVGLLGARARDARHHLSVAGSTTSIAALIGAVPAACAPLHERADHAARARPPPGARARRARTRWPGISIASTTPSLVGPAGRARGPRRARRAPWWWCDFTAACSRPTARAASEPGSSRTLVVGEGAGRVAVVARGRRRPAGAARSCRRARRSASACRGRCPAAACSRSSAPRVRAISKRSRSGEVPRSRDVARRRSCPGRCRQPPASTSAVEPVEQLVGLLGHRGVGRQQQREPAGALDRVARTSAAAGCTSSSQAPPARPLAVRADADDRPRAHRRSKPRKRSQSVTAASYASSSTRARFR